MSILNRNELKAIGAAIRWMELCLKPPNDAEAEDPAAVDREREKLRIAKAAHRKLNAEYKASRPKRALGISADDS